jgi:cytochrome c553
MKFVRAHLRLLAAAALAAALKGGYLARAQISTQPTKSNAASTLHGKELAKGYCADCHDIDGNATANPLYPKIADQKVAYLRLQLLAFRSGARKSDLMSGPARAITEAQIRELARYYSDQLLKPDKVKNPLLASIGTRIFHNVSRGQPPCVACHSRGNPRLGPSGMMSGGRGMGGVVGGPMGMTMGNTAAVPNLYGQHAAYTLQQIDAFAEGRRRSTVMRPIAAALRPQERKAVAEYISGLQ